ncbi:MAG: glycoside hydrolase family 97 protein [Bacteroidales bacterium]|nr:glycoside hydrolase family 97 protein [Bacteroides sp.]MCM1501801.1 glycoside hydrolase family 97 protein [Bacteroidales bacterium]
MKKALTLLAFALFAATMSSAAPKNFSLVSPDGRLAASIELGDGITWAVSQDGVQLIDPSGISMSLTDGTVYGNGKLRRAVRTNSVDHNEITFIFQKYDLVFRAYNEGVAYRFVSKADEPFKVASEEATFNFPEDWNMWASYVCQHTETLESQFWNSFENTYTYSPISGWNTSRLAFLPLLVDAADGKKICITESDLTNYPGMYLYNGDGKASMKGVYAGYPKEIEYGGHNNLQGLVKSREDYIAKYDGATAFPWRIVAVSSSDKELLANRMVYNLAKPADPSMDFSWVRPGKVAWDWWNDWNIKGVDFRAGINNDTYKYYIDFASSNGIEYVILDEGWAVNMKADLMQIIPEIDLVELTRYAAERNVGLILWAGYWAFERDMENVCRHYSEMGIKGFKVDFMDRDDQMMVDFHRRAAEMTAKYGLMIDFHGTYKPAGLDRTFPNVVNYEGVFGLENMKWSNTVDQVTYDVTIPFIRMVAGPMDYTQGAMRNATRGNYRAVNSEGMSQGTRCRQLAEYVVFNSPLCMLCDSPSNYMAEPESMEYISSIPTVWDEIVPLDAKVGDYVAVAKRSGDVWYVGAMTDWDARTMELDLSFLGDGEWNIEYFADGINADRMASDYRKGTSVLPASRKLTVRMAPGGGFAARLSR